ncbi:MAG: polysaccharide deacetylase family protein [Candidatus Marinimicrobia bacterium]|jgi:peptidoglycan/xylan/chitin deacetylase (PgdA/CDA1 family)|nr:polysaccharide deacetylase family protein [Candidatus Neomarinimicrobiota bacterium]MCK9559217.1 polysaccharide deacetylase family protein [Candidatus Neomarinimicrobiota bacterium]
MNNSLILAYHRVLPDDMARLRRPLAISTEQFEKQIQCLVNQGWRSLTLSEYSDFYISKKRKPDKIFVITFDDGYRDNYYYAFPVLKKYNMKATVFLVAGSLFNPNALRFEYTPDIHNVTDMDYFITLEQLKEMADYGIEFGSHTITHPRLDTIGLDEAGREIHKSKEILEHHLNRQVKAFCYPYGAFNDSVIALVSKCGYQCAVVTPNRPGIKDNQYTLNRIGVYNSNSLLKFKLKCSHIFIYIRKAELWFMLKHLAMGVGKRRYV